MGKSIWLALFFLYCFADDFASGYEESFVISTESSSGKEGGLQGENFGDDLVPKIYEMQIESNVSNRFAQTLITSKVRNWNEVAREATFSVILPDKAYISEFVMVIGGQSYKAYVKEKEEARNIYNQAVASGFGAAHVAVTARESNRFTVSLNVEALSKATFLLKYEELLRLKDNKYELVINIHPNQPVEDLYVDVLINESRPLKFVKTAPLRSGNEISKLDGDLDPRASIFRLDPKSAVVQFKPNIEKQKEFAGHLGTDASKGLSGQFVVQYDVERDPHGGEVLVKDGYFVHFFAPSELKPLNKFIIFVLDTSSSMYGQKITQLKQAMMTILEQLDPNDYFQIVDFETNTKVWDIINPGNSSETPKRFGWYRTTPNTVNFTNITFPSAFSGNPDNIKKAKEVILDLHDGGGTNINEALEVALNLIEAEKSSGNHEYLPQPIIMFLTDGDATVGITDSERIITDITNRNNEQAPIYSLSFGDYADKNFLKKLSQRNQGFSRHIYEASDAALQLQNFYKEIASPLLSGVKFEYVPDATSLTKTEFPLHFEGSEIVVAGELDMTEFPILPRIICMARRGPLTLHPTIERPITSLERLWAYLTIQQLLDEKETAQNKTANEKKVLDLALKYSFVTPVSSLVVVKPNSTDSNIETEAADKSEAPDGSQFISHRVVPMRRYNSLISFDEAESEFDPTPSIRFDNTDGADYDSNDNKLGSASSRFHAMQGPPGGVVPLYGNRGISTFGWTQGRSFGGDSFPAIGGMPGQPSAAVGAQFNPHHMYNAPLSRYNSLISYDDFEPDPTLSIRFDNIDGADHDSNDNKLKDLKVALPWLENCLNENGTLKSPPGGYKLGLNTTFKKKPICSETPTNTTGHCELLQACPQVHHLLTSEDLFVRYFCPLNRRHKRFAGVCCP